MVGWSRPSLELSLPSRRTSLVQITPEWVSAIGSLLAGFGTLAAFIAALVAVRAAGTWQKLERAKFESDAAFKLLDLIGELQDAVYQRRSAVVYEGESMDGRKRRVNDAATVLQLTARPYFPLWGVSFREPMQKLNAMIWKLESAHHQLEALPVDPSTSGIRAQLFQVATNAASMGARDAFQSEFDDLVNVVVVGLIEKLAEGGRVSPAALRELRGSLSTQGSQVRA